MIVSDAAINRRITVFVSMVLIVVAGLYAYSVLPRESTPEIVIPILLVSTSYQGVAPADMESLVTIPIERKLTGLSGVKSIQSTSSEGISVIQVEFEADEDVDVVRQKVRDKVDQAKPDLPEEADDPQITEINVSDFPFMFISMTGDQIPLSIMTKLAEDLEDDIEAVKGVLEVNVVGGVEREIQIVVDPDRVTEYGISLADLVTLARVENVNTPAGAMELGEGRFSVRVPGEFTTADEINNLVVKAGQGGVVYMRDIAEIRDGYKDIESISRLNGRRAVTLSVSKRAGENLIDVAGRARECMEAY
ncbi:MAG TPA: efflux RND transporter permease subunit, partial [Candidatus Hydrogenedentes bacterium]|nr:efflux RND transporter permease subunit [Candidatus Hydrogenedentota bacterium]